VKDMVDQSIKEPKHWIESVMVHSQILPCNGMVRKWPCLDFLDTRVGR
jgi:hypothetical protein